MKTPEEWASESYVNNEVNKVGLLRFIQNIQSEAYHECQLSGLQIGKETAMKTIGEVFGKPAERSESV